jgi:hypothetical protein
MFSEKKTTMGSHSNPSDKLAGRVCTTVGAVVSPAPVLKLTLKGAARDAVTILPSLDSGIPAKKANPVATGQQRAAEAVSPVGSGDGAGRPLFCIPEIGAYLDTGYTVTGRISHGTGNGAALGDGRYPQQ